MRCSASRIVALFAISLVLTAAGAAPQSLGGLAVAPDGDIYVVQNFPDDVVYRVDPATGSVSVVSSDAVGMGPLLLFPMGVAVETGGTLAVTVFGGSPSVLRIDPQTGDRTVVADAVTGAGVALHAPRGIALTADGALVVSETPGDPSFERRVDSVDPLSGDRTVLASPTVGTGPVLGFPPGIAVDTDGDVVVTDLGLDAVVRIDPETLERTIVSGDARGDGPRLTRPMALDVAPGGELVVAEVPFDPIFCVFVCPSELCGICLLPAPSIVSVDPASGNRTRVSGGGACLVVTVSDCLTPFIGRKGRGRSFFEPAGVAVEADGSYLVADQGGAILRVNASTGRRRVVADVGNAADPVPASVRARRLRPAASRSLRPQDPEAWLRGALGDAAWARAAHRSPETFVARLSPAERRVALARLSAALWRAMRDSDASAERR